MTARNLVRDLTLLVDALPGGAEADAALVTLLPGETAVFSVRGGVDATEGDFRDPAVLRTLNDLL